jgi:hypothetical protein
VNDKELSQYRALKTRLERNQGRLEKSRDKDISAVNGKVKGSSKNFPYIETHYNVQIYEPNEIEAYNKQISTLEKAIEDDRVKIKAIEDFVNSIDDPELQSVFEMRVYERMKWIDIAEEFSEGKDRTTYSKKYKKYLENSHVSPISQLSML